MHNKCRESYSRGAVNQAEPHYHQADSDLEAQRPGGWE